MFRKRLPVSLGPNYIGINGSKSLLAVTVEISMLCNIVTSLNI